MDSGIEDHKESEMEMDAQQPFKTDYLMLIM